MTTAPAPSSPSCPDENQLALLAEGALADADRAAIEQHLDGCAACTRLVAELAGLAAPNRSAPARYKILRQLGAGAMGVVWEAEDTHLRRKVALKFVTPDAAGDRERRARLLREARALAQLRHPNVLAVHDVGQLDGPDGELFLAIELVIGTDARTWRDAAPRTPAEILAVWRQAAAGIAAVHCAGLIHRDIKPDNVLVADDGRVLVGDFGLATGELVGTATALTQTGAVVGTPLYMAHEQLLGETATKRTDQFALCVSIWEALTGTRPFRGATIAALATAMANPPEPPPRGAGDRHIFAVLARGLASDPARRWRDVDALLAALDRPPPRRRNLFLAIGAASLAGAVTAAIVWTAAKPDREVHASAVGSSVDPSSDDGSGRVDPSSDDGSNTRVDPSSDDGSNTRVDPSSDDGSGKRVDPSSDDGSGKRVDPSSDDGSGRRVDPSSDDGSGVRASDAPTVGVGPAPVRPKKAPRAALAPFAVQPQVARAPAQRSAWAVELDLATDKLGAGDGNACLQVLATLPPIPATHVENAESLRAMCMMAAGDCAGGRAAMEAYGAGQGWDAARIARVVDGFDLAQCPIDAPPRSRWPARAEYRLTLAVGTHKSCKDVRATMAKRGIQLADLQKAVQLETACLVTDGDCSGARVVFRRLFVTAGMDPATASKMEAAADQQFPKAFPTCP